MHEKVINLLSNVVESGFEREKVNGTTDIINEIGLDSLEMIKFLLSVEDEFEIEIDYDEFEISHLNSINRFCEFIDTQAGSH